MAEKDSSEKMLEAYNDVFADIVNVLLFHGKRIMVDDELEEQAPRSAYKADGKLRDIERDVVKRWKRGEIRIACVGFENQTKPDQKMPIRVISYDGAEYRAQLLKSNKQNELYPVVTLVLYYGCEKEWTEPLTLKKCLKVPDELQDFVNDYKINLFQIAFLTREQVELFQSDFKVVADYFVQMREKRDYVPTPQQLVHVQETLQLLSIMAGDHRFEEVYNKDDDSGKGGPKNMCEVLDRIENRGMKRGISEGMTNGTITTLAELVRDGLISRQEAAKRAKLSEIEFERKAQELLQSRETVG